MIDHDYIPAISLGTTQIMAYGSPMYASAILLPAIAEDLGLSLSAIFWHLIFGTVLWRPRFPPWPASWWTESVAAG